MGQELPAPNTSIANELPSPVASETNALMVLIERMAVSQDIDLDRVERAYKMYCDMVSKEAETRFNDDMAKAQNELSAVVANRKNTHTKSTFADLSAIHSAAKPVWTNFGFSVTTKSEKSELDDHVRIISEVRHKAGHKETLVDDWPLDRSGAQGTVNKTAIQAKGSSISYARRYTELMIFDLSVDHEDNDGNPIENFISASEAREITSALKITGSDVQMFCRVLGCDSVETIPKKLLGKARNLINKKKSSQNANS